MEPSKAITVQGIDNNGVLLLLDVFIRKITGQKYISTVVQSICTGLCIKYYRGI